jgi:pimeloyl-ACP methyl ester carboxylesterase
MKDLIARRARFIKHRLGQRRLARALQRPGVPLSSDMDADSRTLLIAFGGMLGRIGTPPFEFFSLAGEIPVKQLFVRDLHQAWYHRGLPGYGPDLESVADALRELLDAHEVDRLVIAGNSAGGYAALLFGTLLQADVVICFAPQTVLDPDVLASIGDHRWDRHLEALVQDDALDRRWADLGPALSRIGNGRTRYEVYFDQSLTLDRQHAERLLVLENLHLYRFGRGRHHLVRALHDSGALAHILQRALRPPAAEAGPVS